MPRSLLVTIVGQPLEPLIWIIVAFIITLSVQPISIGLIQF